MTIIDGAIEEVVKIAARPEIALELLGLDALFSDRNPFHENVVPGHQRHDGQERHDSLHHQTGFEDEIENGEVLRNVHCRAFRVSRK
jgi:hypothetical protein